MRPNNKAEGLSRLKTLLVTAQAAVTGGLSKVPSSFWGKTLLTKAQYLAISLPVEERDEKNPRKKNASTVERG
jgi:hypothetical protein